MSYSAEQLFLSEGDKQIVSQMLLLLICVLIAFSICGFAYDYKEVSRLILRGATEWGVFYASLRNYWLAFLCYVALLLVGAIGVWLGNKSHRLWLSVVSFTTSIALSYCLGLVLNCGV